MKIVRESIAFQKKKDPRELIKLVFEPFGGKRDWFDIMPGDVIEYVAVSEGEWIVKTGIVKEKSSTRNEDFVILEDGKNAFRANITGVFYKNKDKNEISK